MAGKKISKLHLDELADDDRSSRCADFIGFQFDTRASFHLSTHPSFMLELSGTHTTTQIPKDTSVA